MRTGVCFKLYPNEAKVAPKKRGVLQEDGYSGTYSHHMKRQLIVKYLQLLFGKYQPGFCCIVHNEMRHRQKEAAQAVTRAVHSISLSPDMSLKV